MPPILKVEMLTGSFTVNYLNVFYMSQLGSNLLDYPTFDVAAWQSIAEFISLQFEQQYIDGGGNLAAACHSATSFNGYRVRVTHTQEDKRGDLAGIEAFAPGTVVGSVAGDPLPHFVSVSVRYQRPNATYRHGYKRFARVAEGDTSDGISLTTAASVYWQAAATSFLTPITMPANTVSGVVNSTQWAYSQVARTATGGQPLPEWKVAPFISVGGVKLSSQVSRKA